MNISQRSPAVFVRLSLVLAVLGLGACGEADGPLAPDASLNAPAAYATLAAGTYETRTPLLLPSGESVYLVGVYFGAEPREPTYLAQVGVSAGAASRLLMEQDGYTYAGGEIAFAALVERGTVRDGGRLLDVTLVVDEQRMEVRLARR